MNKGKITELLKTKGMEYDETSSSWYGVVSGISVMFTHSEDGRYYNIVIPVTNGGLPDKQSMKDIASQEKTVSAVTVKQYNVSFMVKNALTDNAYLENNFNEICNEPLFSTLVINKDSKIDIKYANWKIDGLRERKNI